MDIRPHGGTTALLGAIFSLAMSPMSHANLIGQWTFNEGIGTTALDTAGSNNGTLSNGASYVANGAGNYAVRFGDGSGAGTGNDSVVIPDGPLFTMGPNFSIEAWVKMDSISGMDWIFGTEHSTIARYGLVVAGGNYRFDVGGYPPVTDFNLAQTPASTGVWDHLIGTFDGATIKLYKNGSLAASTAWAAPDGVYPTSFNPAAGPFYYDSGELDQVRIWDQTLSPQKVTSLYKSGPAPIRPADFGKQWVKSHPFTLGGWYDGPDEPNAGKSQLFTGAGLNMLATYDVFDNNVPLHYWLQGSDDTSVVKQHISDVMDTHPNRTGWIVWDEPESARLPGIGRVVEYLKAVDPDKLIYINLPPKPWPPDSAGALAYDQYLNDVMTIVKPDVLCFDAYPFTVNGPNLSNYFFERIMTIRAKARQFNVPYFGHAQSFEYSDFYLPAATELRADLFSQMTAGYKGFLYYAFETAGISQSLLVTNTNQPSPEYPIASVVNKEAANLGRSLVQLESTDVRFIPTPTVPTASLMTNWSSGAGAEANILSIISTNSASYAIDRDRGNGLIGFFRDDNNQSYFMLTNLSNDHQLSENQAAETFIISFALGINEIYRLNRISGAPERVDLNNHILNLTLPGGTGDLFKFGDGYFAGILPGDTNLDGVVDITDMEALAGHYGLITSGNWGLGDIDLNGDVDYSDLIVMANHYDAGSAQAYADFQRLIAVPEPSTLLTLAAGLGWMSACRKRRITVR